MKPYAGMTVQYYPGADEKIVKHDGQPLAAIVAAVWSDACVNLTVFDVNGYSNPTTSVTLYPRAALDTCGPELGCAYMLPANGMLESEIEHMEGENERLSESNQELGTKLGLSQRENVELRRVNDEMAGSLAMVCEILGGDPGNDTPTLAEFAKEKIEKLSQDLNAICRAGGRQYNDDAVKMIVERLGTYNAEVAKAAGRIIDSGDPSSDRPPVGFLSADATEKPGIALDTRGLDSPVKYRAHAKVMRSYDYNHFEISLSCDDLSSLTEADELRKSAARLAEKGIEQYQKARAFERWKANNRRPDSLSREALDIIGNRPESEWTPEEKATVKRYRDRLYWLNRDYDYEDEFDYEAEREEDEIPV